MLLWLIPTIVYALVALITCRLLTGHFAWHWAIQKAEHERLGSYANFPIAGTETPDEGQWGGAFCVALVIAVVWPAALAFTRVPVKIGAEREAERRQMAARIKELEHEAGL